MRLAHVPRALAVLAVLALSACAALGVATPETFNEKEAAAISTVTGARSTAIALLTADKISATDARNIQTQCDNAREAITIASQIHATDPGAAENRLDAIIVGLNALNAYLATRK